MGSLLVSDVKIKISKSKQQKAWIEGERARRSCLQPSAIISPFSTKGIVAWFAVIPLRSSLMRRSPKNVSSPQPCTSSSLDIAELHTGERVVQHRLTGFNGPLERNELVHLPISESRCSTQDMRARD